MDEFHTGRSGDEPMHARSPLKLRLVLAGIGLAFAIAGIILFSIVDQPALLGVFAAFALVAIVDGAIVLRHIRAGERYQPGPQVPPYRARHVDRVVAAKPRPPISPEHSPEDDE